MSNTALIRRPAVEALTGFKRSTIYRRIEEGLFPKGVDLGGGRKGWPEFEVDLINRYRVAGKSEDDIRALVAKLHADRAGMVA